jgi:hypothetical protein
VEVSTHARPANANTGLVPRSEGRRNRALLDGWRVVERLPACGHAEAPIVVRVAALCHSAHHPTGGDGNTGPIRDVRRARPGVGSVLNSVLAVLDEKRVKESAAPTSASDGRSS